MEKKIIEEVECSIELLEVDRGQVVYLEVTFAGVPDEVNFALIKPGETRPVVDPGWTQQEGPRQNSRIRRLSEPGRRLCTFLIAIDTRGMRGGQINWKCSSAGEFQAAQVNRPKIFVRESPAQLG